MKNRVAYWPAAVGSLIVTPTRWQHMYQFRLMIDGRLIGDTRPCIIGTAIKRLRDLETLGDPGLSLGLSDPAALVRRVASIGALGIESGEEPDSSDTDLAFSWPGEQGEL